ncbi:hypothetical protein [Bosea sp. BK604]|uniref:hypothetical protein n=1 Tax=Bosea sp. BK604 TaxID=2512180 RepID=UPI001046AED5|nr:hypothetical protein [Bosea sp. BK604]TCR66526.1 hypothetical protein EV560_104407 [Bosea sp. BK604]
MKPAPDWRGWTRSFLVTALLLVALLFSFIAMLDPFGSRVGPGQAARPLMDLNQRFMYPQLVRSGRYDAAVFGTSTMRLLDPAILSQGLGAHVVNLAMNAATPWEQLQMVELFTRKTVAPKMVLWGIDQTWCDADATTPEKRLTPRPFPPWLYDDKRWNDWPELINLTTLEIAARLFMHKLGYMPERIRGDGYEVFTPPEEQYDLARARFHLFQHTGGVAPELSPIVPPIAVGAEERAAWRFPALDWLDSAFAALPASTQKLIVLPPLHLGGLPREGSAGWQHYAACKAALGTIAGRHGAVIVDYAHASPITRDDANYWDPLHFRLPIARRVEADLIAVAHGGEPTADGAARVLQPIR